MENLNSLMDELHLNPLQKVYIKKYFRKYIAYKKIETIVYTVAITLIVFTAFVLLAHYYCN